MSFLLKVLGGKSYYKNYMLGAMILTIYALCHRLLYSEIILFCGIIIIEFTFIIWIIQFYKDKIKGKPFYIFIFSIVNLFILWFSNAYAHELVVNSLGLPAEDFGLTLHLLVLICYIPAAIIATIFVFFIVYLCLCILVIFKLAWGLLYSIIHPFLVMFGWAKADILVNKDHRLILHFFVFGVTCLLLTSVLAFIVKHQSSFYPAIRYIAYIVDYEYLYNYPQVDKNKKVKLHENGFVSTMEGNGLHLKVIVKQLDE